jgi:hypothetical protein
MKPALWKNIVWVNVIVLNLTSAFNLKNLEKDHVNNPNRQLLHLCVYAEKFPHLKKLVLSLNHITDIKPGFFNFFKNIE